MAEGSIYGVVRKIDLRPVRLELKCGFRILSQVVDILFLRRRMLYPAELRDHARKNKGFTGCQGSLKWIQEAICVSCLTRFGLPG